MIVLPMKRRICSNLSKWPYLPSHYRLLSTLKRDLGEVNQMTNFQFVLPAPNAIFVMNIEWDYNYYQPWSDNEWLVDEMLAMLDEDIIMQ